MQQTKQASKVAIIGGGLTGLTAAIRLAEQGIYCQLFEAATTLGGRTRSFYEPTMQQLCDNGPHLLLGAYSATQKLLKSIDADQHIHWQASLSLPLWDLQRGHFSFEPTKKAPFALAMLHTIFNMPAHGFSSAIDMLRLAMALQQAKPPQVDSVEQWLQQLGIKQALMRDLLEPLCLGAMNQGIETANAHSFKRVLQESFADRQQARLGWFTAPLQTALIEPLQLRAEQLGVNITTRHRVRQLTSLNGKIAVDGTAFDTVIMALPAYAADRLLGQVSHAKTAAINNIHLWLKEKINMPSPFIGTIGGTGQWYFDISQQWNVNHSAQHICAVISADTRLLSHKALIERCLSELTSLCNLSRQPQLLHSRVICEKRATVLVQAQHAHQALRENIIDACERPCPGELPATIESAIRRGENSAYQCTSDSSYHCYPL
ncbi:MAG: FAD-dependent oxidoreductase [Mariprofundus sp.]|nr:FAD-dependent oxidoreductase [Mariprofundus sp.]